MRYPLPLPHSLLARTTIASPMEASPDLGVSAVVLLVEGVHDAALDWLEAVLDRRNRARADDVRRILAEVEVVKLLHRPEAGEPRLWPRRSDRLLAFRLLSLALRRLCRGRCEDVEIVEQARRKILLVVVFPLFHFGILYHTAGDGVAAFANGADRKFFMLLPEVNARSPCVYFRTMLPRRSFVNSDQQGSRYRSAE